MPDHNDPDDLDRDLVDTRPLPPVDPERDAEGLAFARAQMHATVRRAEAQAQLKRERWGDDPAGWISRLARRFPSLRDAVGIDPWDALTFLRWSDGPQLTGGMAHAIRFVLQVWNASTDWREIAAANGIDGTHLDPFNVARAFQTWDDAHREAFLAWCEAPFFP